MSLFLAVDGGQTTTKVVLADERGKILAQATGGPSDHTEEPGGSERFEQVVVSTVGSALELAGLPSVERQEFTAACFGMTGETEIKSKILRRIVKTARLSVIHDSVNALMGATAGDPGLIVIAGTGSVARGMNAQGQEARVGGWGHLFGDEGSAYWIGREAVRAVAAEYDGFGEKTRLTPMLFERFGVASSFELMTTYYSGERSRDHLAGLSVWVNETAEHQDKVAQTILNKAGVLLANFALAILAILFQSPELSETAGEWKGPLVSYTGGVFQSGFVLTAFREIVLATFSHARIQPPLLPPVLGSLVLAQRSVGMEVTEETKALWLKTFSR